MKSHFGDSYDAHIRFATDDKTIPFSDNSFDIIYANSVFEHLKHIDDIVSECARVLKPGGILLPNFFVGYDANRWTHESTICSSHPAGQHQDPVPPVVLQSGPIPKTQRNARVRGGY